MYGIATTAVFFAFVALESAGGETLVTNWLSCASADAAKALPVIRDDPLTLAVDGKKDVAFWSVFNPLPLSVGKPVTLTFRLLIPSDLPDKADAMIRIGLYGVAADADPTTTRQEDLRGIMLLGGPFGDHWRLVIAQHSAMKGRTLQAGSVNYGGVQMVGNYVARGATVRVVMTITRKSADAISIAGFWADAPFSFEIKQLADEINQIRAVMAARGRSSGTNDMAVINLRLIAD
jgi:hypothetical protein